MLQPNSNIKLPDVEGQVRSTSEVAGFHLQSVSHRDTKKGYGSEDLQRQCQVWTKRFDEGNPSLVFSPTSIQDLRQSDEVIEGRQTPASSTNEMAMMSRKTVKFLIPCNKC
uniref:HTH_48 domain-containing protein n=1 Tax=Steinernema glaseri TaxID=37863 RepID=A0A1I8AKF8_9BILA